jgi:hypothetical protein
MKTHTSKKLYFFALCITLIVFASAIFSSNLITQKKTDELKESIDKISVDILSFETQFDVLKESSCSSNATSTITSELDGLSSRLGFMEDQVGDTNPEVFRLKRYYALLSIKDYLLRKRLAEQCGTSDIFILYFYSKKDCAQCERQEYMLKAIRTEYPEAHIYSFDYDLDLRAANTLISLHNIPETPPVIDIQGKPYAAFAEYDDMKHIVEKEIAVRAIRATSTSATLKTLKK